MNAICTNQINLTNLKLYAHILIVNHPIMSTFRQCFPQSTA